MTAAAVAIFVGLVSTSAASAGTYEVAACRDAAGAAGGWSAFNTRTEVFETGSACDNDQTTYGGLFSRDRVVQPINAATSDRVGVAFNAAAGTQVLAVTYSRFTQIVTDDDWQVGLRVVSGPAAGLYDDCTPTGLSGCSVGAAGVGAQRTLTGLRTDRLEFGIACEPAAGNSSCAVGATTSEGPQHYVSAVLYAARVLVEDATPPTAATPTGPSGWVHGSVSVTVGGNDEQSGLRRLEAVTSDAARGAVSLSCSSSEPVPCPTGALERVVPVDTQALSDGIVSLRSRAVDAGGEATLSPSSYELHVDNTPPTAPAVAAPGADGSWSGRTSDQLRVEVGEEQGRAPISAVEVERCEPSGSCTSSTVPADGAGTRSVPVEGLAEGVTTLRARLIDEAGNTGAWSARAQLLVDRSAPGPLELTGVSDAWVAAAPAVHATGQPDVVSGTARTELEVCSTGGACSTRVGAAPPADIATAVGEGEYRLRVRQVDHAGLQGAWSAPQRLRVDSTAPVASVTAAPNTVTAGTTFSVRAAGQDTLSGLRSAALQVEENGVWRVAVIAVVARPGIRYRFRAEAIDFAGNRSQSVPTSVTTVTASSVTAVSRLRIMRVKVRAARRASTGAVSVVVDGAAQHGSHRVRLRVSVGRRTVARVLTLHRPTFAATLLLSDPQRRARRVSVSASVVGSKAKSVTTSSLITRRR